MFFGYGLAPNESTFQFISSVATSFLVISYNVLLYTVQYCETTKYIDLINHTIVLYKYGMVHYNANAKTSLNCYFINKNFDK